MQNINIQKSKQKFYKQKREKLKYFNMGTKNNSYKNGDFKTKRKMKI